MPTNDSRFAAAMIPPLSSSAGRCWISAFTGTAKNPAQKPSIPSSTADPMQTHAASAERKPVNVMPIEPSGISPYSILLPLSRPAIMLPMPMPTASVAFR